MAYHSDAVFIGIWRINSTQFRLVYSDSTLFTDGEPCSDYLRVVHIHCEHSHFADYMRIVNFLILSVVYLNARREYELLAANMSMVQHGCFCLDFLLQITV